MSELHIHWHGLSCCEIRVVRPQSPLLFRQLGEAARKIRAGRRAANAVSAYESVAVYWSKPIQDRSVESDWIAQTIGECLAKDDGDDRQPTSHQIAVQYDGPDLKYVAVHSGLTTNEVIQVHASTDYVVAAIGFLPHFAYLWGLDERLSVPRRSAPRVRVPAGTVGIGGNQTGIYPQQSPGGWQLIGRVDESVVSTQCAKFEIGDLVRFESVS